MLSINKRTIFLYFFLFTGVFNDVLRIPSTAITLFRVLLPFAIIISLYCSKNVRIIYTLFVAFSLLSFVQSFLFCIFNRVGVSFDPLHLAEFLFYYACVIVVIGSVIVIFEQDRGSFLDRFQGFIKLNAFFLTINFIMFYYDKNTGIVIFNNPNDYGAFLVMVIPLFYYCSRKIFSLFFLPYFIVIILYSILNDCRLALLGFALQIVIIICLEISKKRKGTGWVSLIAAAVLFFVLVLSCILSTTGFEINQRDWNEIIVEPVERILTGRTYNDNTHLNSYRTDVFIEGLKWVWKTKLLGIGAGNYGLLLRRALNGDPGMPDWFYLHEYVSPHNAFLEFLVEWGFVAVIGFGLIIREIVICLRKGIMTDIDKSFVTISISSLVWMQAPSGILVDYFIFIVFTYLLIIVVYERKAGTRLNEDQV